MTRGSYTMEMFNQPAEMDAHIETLLNNLARAGRVSVRLLSADTLVPVGSA